ncbi:uncharacterized protein LTR77_010725 [Saxophila tyrrhenica]|uniref:Uncharacterized protein n=1 Tax=Saxophila tyrrhenica TaxID=1690608 RepID=A0AAV9NY69_9PEZI|nr:hypothetical protein LTR77_010725 [Saxophila tyrrhenica]
MADNVQLSSKPSSFQAVFALDLITSAIALAFLALATKPTFVRIKRRRFSTPGRDRGAPLKTTLGTYLFLYPGLFCFFLAYTLTWVADLLKSSGSINYNGEMQLHGRFPVSNTSFQRSSAILSWTVALASIFFTALINGGVWIYSSHLLANGTFKKSPSTISRIWNTFIISAILATGLAAWGLGMSHRSSGTTWSDAVYDNSTTRALFVAYRAVVIGASLSVSFETLWNYFDVNSNSSKDSSERPHLARFTFVVVPMIWLRNAFIIYDIVLIYLDSAGWSTTTKLASRFLLIIFGQFVNLTILGMILWGAWKTGRTVRIFEQGKT